MLIQVLTLTIVLPLLAFTLLHLLKPNPKKHPDPKSLSELRKNGHRIVEWTSDLTAASHTGTVTTFMGVHTADPTTVEHFTKTKFESYINGSSLVSVLHDFLGDGIFNSDGDHWKLQRRIASLEFSTNVIRTFVMSNIHSQVSTRLLPALRSRAEDGHPFDVQELLERFAIDNVCKVVFDDDLDRLGLDSPDSKEFNEAFERASNLSVARFSNLIPGVWKLKRILNVGSEKELREKIAIMHCFITKAVRSRKVNRPLGDDLLSKFVAENGDYSDEFLRDVIVNFVVAGRDTTFATLTWFLWEIGRRPDVQKKVLEEIKRVRKKDENFQVFSLSRVREMEYMHAVLSETLRLHPPAPLVSRMCVEDDVLPDGTKVKKGTMVYYNSYAMGRSTRIWGEDCEEFRPERWLDEEGVFQPRSPYVYPVFHGGPRICLGKDMAYTQMKVVAGMMVERFEVKAVEKEKVMEHELIFIMKMKGGLMVKVEERK